MKFFPGKIGRVDEFGNEKDTRDVFIGLEESGEFGVFELDKKTPIIFQNEYGQELDPLDLLKLGAK